MKRKRLTDFLTSPPRRRGYGCQTCGLPNIKELNAALKQYIQAWAKLESRKSWAEFHAWLRDPENAYSYPLSLHALLKHVRACLGLRRGGANGSAA